MRKNFRNRRPQKPKTKFYPKDIGLKVTVRDGNVDAALRVLKKKVKKDGMLQTLKEKEFFQTRRTKRRLLKAKAIRRRKRQELKEKESKHLVSVFILPPSTIELEKRLLNRAQDSKEEVKKRMSEATSEMTHWAEYDYVIINDVLEQTLQKLIAILTAERLKRKRQTGLNNFVRKVIF